jgi:hypothetical protein
MDSTASKLEFDDLPAIDYFQRPGAAGDLKTFQFLPPAGGRNWALTQSFYIPRSSAQSYFQHRFRVVPKASLALLLARYPYESLWNTLSNVGSKTKVTTVCAMRSVIVGILSGRDPPPFFGISTRSIGSNS